MVRHEVAQVIVRMEIERTCGSVRSSLSAPALPATEVLEAAETTYLRRGAKRFPRGSLQDCQRKGGLRVRLDDKSKVDELPQAPSNYNEPKALKGSNQKVLQSAVPLMIWGTRTHMAAGVEAGTNPSALLGQNMVNPTSRLSEAGTVARLADGVAGRGSWNKRTPPCNRADRGCKGISPRKRADFQPVARDEKAGRTCPGGNRK